jgi:hypothetical protein
LASWVKTVSLSDSVGSAARVRFGCATVAPPERERARKRAMEQRHCLQRFETPATTYLVTLAIVAPCIGLKTRRAVPDREPILIAYRSRRVKCT